jgi:UDP-N-acetylmuramate dehydrogenase
MKPAILEQVDLREMTTLAVPAVADYFAELTEPAELEPLLEAVRKHDWPVTVLGEGSNVVLADRLPGLTLRQACPGITVLEELPDQVRLEVAAGENWHDFVNWSLEQGYYGLENLALIPGTVGAAPIQNIGAYGVEIGRYIESVRCRELPSGKRLVLSAEECEFDYRYSIFKRKWRDRALIESVTLCLPRTPNPVTSYPSLARWLEDHGYADPGPREVFAAVVAIRLARLPNPAEVPNAGSFFKNPRVSDIALETLRRSHPDVPHYADERGGYKLPAAWLIEQCGFKGRDDEVRVDPDHALVIINPERRPASEIAALAREIETAVAERFGIRLEQEPRSYGVMKAVVDG